MLLVRGDRRCQTGTEGGGTTDDAVCAKYYWRRDEPRMNNEIPVRGNTCQTQLNRSLSGAASVSCGWQSRQSLCVQAALFGPLLSRKSQNQPTGIFVLSPSAYPRTFMHGTPSMAHGRQTAKAAGLRQPTRSHDKTRGQRGPEDSVWLEGEYKNQ